MEILFGTRERQSRSIGPRRYVGSNEDMTQPSTVRPSRLDQQLQFVMEVEKLKTVLRQSPVIGADRRENDAEHSWHLALLAYVLQEYAQPSVNTSRVMLMLLIHDIVEIDAGDTFLYDDVGALDQEERENRAADRLFGLLPKDQAAEMLATWKEFELRESEDSKYARALDRLQPLLLNFHSGGGTWKHPAVTRDKVLARKRVIEDASPELWAYALELINTSVRLGILRES